MQISPWSVFILFYAGRYSLFEQRQMINFEIIGIFR